jgi:hypothetical protein
VREGARLLALHPRRTWAPPGGTIVLEVLIGASEASSATLVVELLDVGRPVLRVERRVRTAAGP